MESKIQEYDSNDPNAPQCVKLDYAEDVGKFIMRVCVEVDKNGIAYININDEVYQADEERILSRLKMCNVFDKIKFVKIKYISLGKFVLFLARY